MLFNNARRIIIFLVGSVVIVVGIAGLVLPLIPGLVVIPVGIAILATEFLWAKRLLARIKEGGTTIMDKLKGHTASANGKKPEPSPLESEGSHRG